MLTETHLTKIHDNTFTFTFLKSSQWFKNVVIGALPLTMITFMSRQVGFDLVWFGKSCSRIYDEPISTLFIVSEPDSWI